MKTPQVVGLYRFSIIKSMLAGNLTIAQAEALQKISDKEAMHLVMKNSEK